jgi:predicted MFS family arabinose efflux permease
VAGLAAQVTQGAAAAGLILVIRGHTGSLSLAGAVVGALWVTAAIARPVQGRLIDRRGAAGVMTACGVLHPGALTAIVALCLLDGPRWPLVLLGVLAGATLPPVSTSMRVACARLVGSADRTSAYSLVYLTQELAILTGPAVLAAAIAASSASVAMVVVAGLAAAGTLVFAGSIPRSGRHPAPVASPRPHALRSAGMRMLLALALMLGTMIGAIQVAASTLAIDHGVPAAAGLLVAAVSLGGIIGAAIYGSRRWRTEPSKRLLVLLALVTVALGPMLAASSVIAMALLLLAAGLPLNPALTTCSLLVDQHVAGRAAAEAFGWLSTAIAAGTGAGSAIAAALAQHGHHAAAFLVAALAGAAACAVTLGAGRVLRARPVPG